MEVPEIQASSRYPGGVEAGSPEGQEEPEVSSELGEGKGSEEVVWATLEIKNVSTVVNGWHNVVNGESNFSEVNAFGAGQ